MGAYGVSGMELDASSKFGHGLDPSIDWITLGQQGPMLNSAPTALTVVIVLTAQTKISTVSFRRTCWCRPTACASGFHRDFSSLRAPSTSPGFRTTTNTARSSSARGLTTGFRSAWNPLKAVSTSATTWRTESGRLSVYSSPSIDHSFLLYICKTYL